jgi:D-arabinose 1-dehydrogenase-like Zn-dependent alcohol dehydrogenase
MFRVGAQPKPIQIPTFVLLFKRPIISGSLIGGMKETQEMLDFCGKHGVTCDIEKIDATPESISTAYERTLKSDVKYRFVLDILNAFK